MVNYIKGKICSSDMLICFIALFVFIQFLFGNDVINQNCIDAKEAYILVVNSKSSIAIYIMCMFIAMRYISKYNTMYVLRFGKKKWVIAELSSLIITIITFQLMLVLTCFLWFPRIDIHTWSPTFLVASEMDTGFFRMNVGAVYKFTDWILFSEPMKAFLISLLLHILLGVLIAMICYYCNLYHRIGYGLFVGFALFGMTDILLIYENTFGSMKIDSSFVSLLFLYDNAYIGNLSFGCKTGFLSVPFCILWYFLLIAFFIILIIGNSKKIEVA